MAHNAEKSSRLKYIYISLLSLAGRKRVVWLCHCRLYHCIYSFKSLVQRKHENDFYRDKSLSDERTGLKIFLLRRTSFFFLFECDFLWFWKGGRFKRSVFIVLKVMWNTAQSDMTENFKFNFCFCLLILSKPPQYWTVSRSICNSSEKSLVVLALPESSYFCWMYQRYLPHSPEKVKISAGYDQRVRN